MGSKIPGSHKIALRSYDLYFERNQTVNAKHAHKGLIHILPNPAHLISFLPYFISKQSHELSLTQLLPPSISHGMWNAFRDQQPHNLCLILNLPKKSLQAIYVKQFLTPYNYNKTIFPILQCQCCEARPMQIYVSQILLLDPQKFPLLYHHLLYPYSIRSTTTTSTS